MAKIKDPNAGVPGGYFLAEDGETYVNALGEPVEKLSDAELAKYPVHQVKPDADRDELGHVQRVVTITQAELDKQAKAAAKAAHDASETKDPPNVPAKPRTTKAGTKSAAKRK